MTGETYGRLKVLSRVGLKNGISVWKCICECGNVVNVLRASLINGNTSSCGCLRKEIAKEKHTSHGMSKLPTYKLWMGIKKRCENPNDKAYNNYGGRGIKVYDEWHSFENFLRDMGEKPEGMSLDRIDNDKGYYKENCRWATAFTQSNNKRNNKMLTYKNKTQSMSLWATEIGMSYDVLSGRIFKGWSTEKAIEAPVGKRTKITKEVAID